MLKLKYKLIIFNLFVFSQIQNCIPDAPHDNPLDPIHSTATDFSSISGSVLTLYSPHTQLPGVSVLIKEAGRITQTNPTGDFKINNLAAGKYSVIVSKENYQSDTINVNVQLNRSLEMEPIYLNAIPLLKEIEYFSEVKRTTFSIDPIIQVVINVSVLDMDGNSDIDLVQAWLPDYSFKMAIDSSSLFIVKDSVEFDIFTLQETPLFIIIKDKPGFESIAGPFFIHQFITTNPKPISPGDLEVAIQPLLFTWEKLELPYSYSYEINIIRKKSGVNEDVFTQNGIGSDQTSFSFNQFLTEGIYFWQISIRDNKNNLSQSSEAIFRIQ